MAVVQTLERLRDLELSASEAADDISGVLTAIFFNCDHEDVVDFAIDFIAQANNAWGDNYAAWLKFCSWIAVEFQRPGQGPLLGIVAAENHELWGCGIASHGEH